MSLFFLYCDGAPRDLHSFPHDALPISDDAQLRARRDEAHGRPAIVGRNSRVRARRVDGVHEPVPREPPDRKSTRLNSSHTVISYAVFCLKKKKNKTTEADTATKPRSKK